MHFGATGADTGPGRGDVDNRYRNYMRVVGEWLYIPGARSRLYKQIKWVKGT